MKRDDFCLVRISTQTVVSVVLCEFTQCLFNSGGFVDKVCVASRSYISRGCRTNHIPGLSEESKSLYEEYKKQYASDPFDNSTIETGIALMNTMKEEKKKRWEEVITSTNMTHNSRKAWKIIKHLSNDPTSPIAPCLVSANQVAH